MQLLLSFKERFVQVVDCIVQVYNETLSTNILYYNSQNGTASFPSEIRDQSLDKLIFQSIK